VAFLGVTGKSGAIVRERVAIGELPDGTEITIPVAVARGTKDGPTLYVQGGLHGDELTGIAVARRVLAGLDASKVVGTVVIVPIANVPSHLTRSRGYLSEERWLIDVNRSFPGDRHGLLSHRIANILLEEFVVASDLTIDLHSALDGCNIAPFSYLDPADDDNGTLEIRERVARVLGLPYVYRKKRGTNLGTSNMSATLNTQSDIRGAAVSIAEMGESRRVTEEFADLGVRGVRNAMVEIGVLEGDLVDVPAPQEFTSIAIRHVERGGGLQITVALGDEVTSGQEIGTVVDAFGDVVERLTSPTDGFILRRMELGSVTTGAEAVWVAS